MSIQSAASCADFASVTSSGTNRASAPPGRAARARPPAPRLVPRAGQHGDAAGAQLARGLEADPLVGPGDQGDCRSHATDGSKPADPAGETAVPGTGSTTHRAPPGATIEDMNSTRRTELAAFLRARRARLSPRQAGLPAAGRAPHAGAAPPGGGPAGRPVGGLLHPAGAGPRPAPVAPGAGRAGPGADAHRGRARLPVPHGRRVAAAGAPAEPGDHARASGTCSTACRASRPTWSTRPTTCWPGTSSRPISSATCPGTRTGT